MSDIKPQSSEGINLLANVLHGRTKAVNNTPPQYDYGTIQPDMGLLTNKFPVPIPQSDYMVCRSLTWGAEILVGEKFRSIKPGDRVLVIWVGKYPDCEACIIDIVYRGTAVR